MGARTDPATRGDAITIIKRVIWLAEQAKALSQEIDLYPGPSFSFYQDRWNSDNLVQIMGMAERGMHLTLMTYAWQQEPPCSLPDDDVLLRAWCGHPGPEGWAHSRAVLFSGKDGQPKRAWRYFDGRWWQVGLCRTLIEQIVRRLRRQKAAHARYAGGKDKDRAKASAALQVKCSDLLDALLSLPTPLPLPFPSPLPGEPNGSPKGEAPAAGATLPVEEAWADLVERRSALCAELGIEATAMHLTDRRRSHLATVLEAYGLDGFRQALAGLGASDYHLGTGKHAEAGPRLSFEAITNTGGAVNQVEVLMQLAAGGGRRSSSSKTSRRPFVPSAEQGGDDVEGCEIS